MQEKQGTAVIFLLVCHGPRSKKMPAKKRPNGNFSWDIIGIQSWRKI